MSADELARRARAFHRQALRVAAVEALAIGLAAGLLAAAAGRLGGDRLEGGAAEAAGLVVAALLAAAFAAAAFFVERRPSEVDSVRRLDRRLAADGAIRTAWEHRVSASATRPIVALLGVRAAERLAGRRPAVRPSPGYLGGVLVALALALAVDPDRGEPGPAGAARRGAGPAGISALGAATGQGESDPAPGDPAAGSAEARARALAIRASGAADPDERRRAARELEALLRDLPAAERAGLEQALRGAADAAVRAAAGDGGDSPGSGARGWSERGPGGMMSGRSAAVGSDSAAPPADAAGPDRAAPGPRLDGFGWIGSDVWPPEYQEMAERFVELRTHSGTGER